MFLLIGLIMTSIVTVGVVKEKQLTPQEREEINKNIEYEAHPF